MRKLIACLLILGLAAPALARDGDKSLSGKERNISKNEKEAQLDAEYQAALEAAAEFDATCGCDRTQAGWSDGLSEETMDSWRQAYEQYENYKVEAAGAQLHKDYEIQASPW
jgi:hypothetical protein